MCAGMAFVQCLCITISLLYYYYYRHGIVISIYNRFICAGKHVEKGQEGGSLKGTRHYSKKTEGENQLSAHCGYITFT